MTLPYLDPNWTDNFDFLRPEPDSWSRNNLLYHLARLSKAKVTVEVGIGSWCNGVYAFGKHAQEVGGIHCSIDIYHGWCNRANIIKDHYGFPVEVICADSKTVKWNRWINLCYIDGDHSYEGVAGDIENFAPKIRKAGLLIFDDYGKKHLEVTQAVDAMYDPEKWEMTVFPVAWWAIWRRL